MVTVADGQESHEGNLHTAQSTKSIPGRVADVEATAVATHTEQNEDMERDQVSDEHISTPGRDHVSVEQRSQRSPHNGALLHGLDPQEEGENKQENGNGLVIVTTRHRPRDVTGGNAHERSGQETSRRRARHLTSQQIHGKGRESGEAGGEQNANISNIDGDGQEAQDVVDDAASHHETGV